MPITKSEVSKIVKLNLKKVPASQRQKVKDEVGSFVVLSILDSLGDGESPVAGESFKELSKDYAEAQKGGDRTPNLELLGDMLNTLTFENHSSGIKVGIFDESETVKAYGHNTGFKGHKHLANKGLKRRFIPSERQKFVDDITDGIKDIVKEFEVTPSRKRTTSDGETIEQSISATVTADDIFSALEDIFSGREFI